jgi:DNA-binding CsgD family transcriptional regulator
MLTPSELEVLKLLSIGLKNDEIAIKRNTTIDSVKTHCKNIYKKLAVKNKTQAALKYKLEMENK